MTETIRVVARYLNGKVLKGTTQDFYPNRAGFHLTPVDGGPTVEVLCRELKAVFFVKDFAGNPDRRDPRGFIAAPGETTHGKKIAVQFKDGELICGYTLSYVPDRAGFFMTPADSRSNSLRIYVQVSSAVQVKAGPAADVLAQKSLAAKEES
jgi:hypothetical protein